MKAPPIGREEGREEGIEKGRIEVAKNMLAGGLDVRQVAQFSGFSVEEVRLLADLPK